MGGRHSKQKGSSFERTVCKELSLWVTNGQRKDCFWRSAMSGGRATVARKKGVSVRQAGDITAVAPEGNALTEEYYIECKHYKTLKISEFMIKSTGPLAEFWKKACSNARKHSRTPVLIVRQNNFPVIVLTRPSILSPGSCLWKSKIKKVEIGLFDDVLRGSLWPM